MKRTEDAIQKSIVGYLRMVLPDALVVHVPNAPRSRIAGAILKSMGMLAGFPDLIILRRGVARFMEVKTDIGALSPKQRDFQRFCIDHGFDWALVRSVEDARHALLRWQVMTREAA